jgi:hypothetical protein
LPQRPGAPWYVAALLLFVATAVAFAVTPKSAPIEKAEVAEA